MERITSSHNPLVQHMRKLQTSRAYRESCGEFVADGGKLLEEALKWYPEGSAVLTSEPERCPALPSSARLVEVPASLMQSVSSMRTPQGVLFSLRLPQEGALRVQPGMLLLDRIQDPGNVGTILRTLDAFDFDGLLLLEGCADPWSVKTVRSSMGAVFRRPIWTLRAQELPGLWNGAMARWNTVFVDVPVTTFSPVKVVLDLLRPQHQ